MSISDNLATIVSNIKFTVANRKFFPNMPETVKILAVTKNQSPVAILEAIDAGITAIGENRVQEATSTFSHITHSIEWHLIGHLQTNKVRQAVNMFDLIHSVDSEKLALEINRAAGKVGKRQCVLVEVNISGEETKFGVPRQQVIPLAKVICQMDFVQFCGLMTVAPLNTDPETARPVFRELYNLYSELQALHIPNANIQWLSMGMTNDYQVAIEEGSNLVRIGTGIFGPRPQIKKGAEPA